METTAGIVEANGITVAYETFGDARARPLLLVMGLGASLLSWDEGFCEQLARSGFFVVRYDNRDTGLSTHFHDAPCDDLASAFTTSGFEAPYLIADMAEDAVGLLDALGIDTAHVVGASMGGMIAQQMVIAHPERVSSLTSIMSTPAVALSPPSDEVIEALLLPEPATKEEAIERHVITSKLVSSTGFEFDEGRIRRLAAAEWDRGYDPQGGVRHVAAIIMSPSRLEALAAVRTPTLVVHGDADPLVSVAGGYATAKAVPEAELLVVPGMGHDLPRAIWDTLIGRVAALAERAETAS